MIPENKKMEASGASLNNPPGERSQAPVVDARAVADFRAFLEKSRQSKDWHGCVSPRWSLQLVMFSDMVAHPFREILLSPDQTRANKKSF